MCFHHDENMYECWSNCQDFSPTDTVPETSRATYSCDGFHGFCNSYTRQNVAIQLNALRIREAQRQAVELLSQRDAAHSAGSWEAPF